MQYNWSAKNLIEVDVTPASTHLGKADVSPALSNFLPFSILWSLLEAIKLEMKDKYVALNEACGLFAAVKLRRLTAVVLPPAGSPPAELLLPRVLTLSTAVLRGAPSQLVRGFCSQSPPRCACTSYFSCVLWGTAISSARVCLVPVAQSASKPISTYIYWFLFLLFLGRFFTSWQLPTEVCESKWHFDRNVLSKGCASMEPERRDTLIPNYAYYFSWNVFLRRIVPHEWSSPAPEGMENNFRPLLPSFVKRKHLPGGGSACLQGSHLWMGGCEFTVQFPTWAV